MEGHPPVTVLRLGHRPGRDERMTTHVALTARALGADRVLVTTAAAGAIETVEDVTARFGGPFEATVTTEPRSVLEHWDGTVVHLTMYGEPVQSVMPSVRGAHAEEELLVVVGAGKVSFDVYEAADWNVAVTNQPHSEVAALGVFLDRLFEGTELERSWRGGDRRVVPQATGKRVESREDGESPQKT